MIVIRVELWPYGSNEPKQIAGAVIYNTGAGDIDNGNYDSCFSLYAPVEEAKYKGEVKGFRRREQDVWKLISKMLNAALEEEKAEC